MVDVFQLMGRRHATGILRAARENQQIDVCFLDGMLLRVVARNRPLRERLGMRMVRAGLVPAEKLNALLDLHRRMNRKFGTVLLLKAGVKAEQLELILRLQALETLYGMLGWTEGTYELVTDQPPVSDGVNDLNVRWESALMEGMRRLNEWPAIQVDVPSGGTTFTVLKEITEADAVTADPDADFDAAFMSGGDESASVDRPGPHELAVAPLVQEGVTAQEIADRSLIGEFEAFSALARLVRLGYLEIQAEDIEM